MTVNRIEIFLSRTYGTMYIQVRRQNGVCEGIQHSTEDFSAGINQAWRIANASLTDSDVGEHVCKISYELPDTNQTMVWYRESNMWVAGSLDLEIMTNYIASGITYTQPVYKAGFLRDIYLEHHRYVNYLRNLILSKANKYTKFTLKNPQNNYKRNRFHGSSIHLGFYLPDIRQIDRRPHVAAGITETPYQLLRRELAVLGIQLEQSVRGRSVYLTCLIQQIL